jgi:hypothetical protein
MKIDFIEKIIQYHVLTFAHEQIIYTHDWIDERFTIGAGHSIFCSKCKIVFGYVLYQHQRPDNTKWHELTCNEIIIKKLLE